MRSFFPFVMAHWTANWRLLTTTGAGFMVAACLLAISPLYWTIVEEASVRFEMEQQALENLDVQLVVPFRPIDLQTHQQMDHLIQDQIDIHLGWMTRAVVEYGNTPEFSLITAGQPLEVTPSTPSTIVQFLSGLEEHVSLLNGRWWNPDGGADKDGNAEVIIGQDAAEAVGLRVGDQIAIIPESGDLARLATLTIVGIMNPVNPQDEYWLGYDRHSPIFPGPLVPPTVPIFIQRQAFLDTIGSTLAPQTATYWWFMFITKASLTTDTLETAGAGVTSLENEVSSAFPRATALTSLNTAVARHEARLLFSASVLRILLVFTLGVVFLYLVVVGSILVERQGHVLTLMRSRGFSTIHILTPLACEAVLLAIVSGVIAPFVASLILRSFAVPLESLVGANLPKVLPGTNAYLFVSVGMVVAVTALLLPAFALIKTTGTRLRGAMSRAQESLIVTRLYLDCFLILLGGILWWEFTRTNTGVSSSILGPPAESPLLVVAPFLFLVGLVFLFLRLLPVLARVAAFVTTPFVPTWFSLGLWMLGRHPTTPVRLTVLVATASASSVLACAILPTVTGSVGSYDPVPAGASSDPLLAMALQLLVYLTVPSLAIITALGSILIGQAVLQERLVQIGILKALGMSYQELTRWFVAEHLILLIIALGIGVWLGHQLTLQVLPILDVGVKNPYIPQITQVQTTWPVIWGFGLLITFTMLSTLAVNLKSLRRSTQALGLRLGEET